jgi:hypothetical protein
MLTYAVRQSEAYLRGVSEGRVVSLCTLDVEHAHQTSVLYPHARCEFVLLFTSAYVSIRQHTSLDVEHAHQTSVLYPHTRCEFVLLFMYIHTYTLWPIRRHLCVCVCVYTYIHKYIHT